MELRWYWRILQRRFGVIWRTLALVAVLSLLYTGYGYYSTRYKVMTTIEFYEQPPNIGGNQLTIDPVGQALGTAGGATGAAKFFTEQHSYFVSLQDGLKQRYGITRDWKVLQAGLGANIPGGRDFELEYTSSDEALASHIVTVATDLVEKQFLPTYNADTLQPGARPNITTFPIQVRTFDPLSTKTPSLSTTLLGWITKSLAGLIVGVALAFLWEYLDETIHDDHDVRTWMGTPILGIIPRGKGRAA